MKETKSKTKSGTEVSVVVCNECNNGIYSVARHDFHECPCGFTFIDGGFDYLRVGYKTMMCPITFNITIPQSKKELYEDYNQFNSQRKYGTISWDEIQSLYNKQSKKNKQMVARKTKSPKESRK